MLGRCCSSPTLQAEDAVSKSIHNVFQCSFICHIEEVLIIRVTGNVFNLIQEGLGIDSTTIIVTKDL